MKSWHFDYRQPTFDQNPFGVLRETGEVVKVEKPPEDIRYIENLEVCVYPSKDVRFVGITDVVPLKNSIKDLLNVYYNFYFAMCVHQSNEVRKSNMASLLYYLIGKSDIEHFHRFEMGFPEHTELWKIWHNSPTETDFVNTFKLLEKEYK